MTTRKTATEAMNLRPRGQHAAAGSALDDRLTAVLELHTMSEVAPPLCRECLTPHPCRTVLAAHGDAATPAPPEVPSQ